MRSKAVVLTLLAGAAILVLLGVVHSLLNRKESPPGPPAVATPSQPPDALANPTETNVLATTPAEDREAQKQKDLEAISEALVNGEGDPRSVIEIGLRMENLNTEVRAAAREAAMHLGDTNIIPYLNAALDHLQDAREKVACLDAITYLQTPSMADTTPDGTSDPVLTNAMPLRGKTPPPRGPGRSKRNPPGTPPTGVKPGRFPAGTPATPP